MRRLFILLALVGGLAARGGQQPSKQTVPDKKALATAEDLVNDIFKEDIAKANDAEARTKLAAYLVQQGDDSGDDPAARYVLYRQARQLAIAAGNCDLTIGCVDKTALHFQVAALDLKAEALGQLVKHVPAREPSKALAELALALITEALEADNYAAAEDLGKAAAAAAVKSQVVPLVTTVKKRNAEIQAAKDKFSVLQPFIDRLSKDPNDAEANHKLGEYFGLFKGKWERAIPLLARSKSEPLATLAGKDLVGPKDAKEQAALADLWWDYAAKQPEPQQLRLQERAAYWYDKATPMLSGLSLTKAQKRIEQVAVRLHGVRPVAAGPVGFINELQGHTLEIRELAISRDGRLALSGSVDRTVRLWDLAASKEMRIFKGHTNEVWGVAFVPGDKYVLSASWDHSVRLWELATGNEVRSFPHPIDVNSVAVSSDGKWMLTGSDDKYLRLWDLPKAEEVRKFPPHGNFCYSCAFAPNGLLVASGSRDRHAVVYELATGKVVLDVEQNNNAVTDGSVYVVAFSPDSRHLFTCGDNAAHMWNIAAGKEEKKFESAAGSVKAMALVPGGKRLITGGQDGIVRVWDVASSKELTHFTGHTQPITAVTVSSDGRRVLSGQQDGGIRCWGLPAD